MSCINPEYIFLSYSVPLKPHFFLLLAGVASPHLPQMTSRLEVHVYVCKGVKDGFDRRETPHEASPPCSLRLSPHPTQHDLKFTSQTFPQSLYDLYLNRL